MAMKIMLVTPAFAPSGERWMPLGLCYIASSLERAGHEVLISDRYLQALRLGAQAADEHLIGEVRAFHPDIVGFTTVTPYIHDTVEAVRAVRAACDARILLGGHHVTAFPELTLQRIPQADAVITGEAETSFCLYASGADKSTIPGLYWLDGTIRRSDARGKHESLDDLPLPAYHLIDMAYYTGKNASTIRPFYLRTGSALSARGCRNRCAYCSESLTFSGGLRTHSPDYVFDNIAVLKKDYGCNGITFLDNDFLVDRQRAETILRGIIARQWNKDMIFCIQARADSIDDGIARLMKQAGFLKAEIGLETSSQASLDQVGKNLQADVSENAVSICRKHGISVQANLIHGLEGETIDTLNATLDWIKRLKLQNIKWGSLKVYPGTLLYKQRGGAFFENNEWTRENIERYFREDHVSGISFEDRKRWLDSRLIPYQRYTYHRGLLTHNAPGDILRHYARAVVRKITVRAGTAG